MKGTSPIIIVVIVLLLMGAAAVVVMQSGVMGSIGGVDQTSSAFASLGCNSHTTCSQVLLARGVPENQIDSYLTVCNSNGCHVIP